MAVKIENECCGCAVPGYPCLGDLCKLRRVEHCYCDKCKKEVPHDEVYCYEGEDVCEDCLKALCEKEW